MTRGQVERAYFGSTARCNARLRQLFDHGYVLRHYPACARFGAQAVYSAGKSALPLIATGLGMEAREAASYYRRTRSPSFVEHTAAVVEVWLDFVSGRGAPDGAGLDHWLAEMQCRHEWDIRVPGEAWRRESFKPDGFARVAGPGARDFFIEVDLGHTSSRQFVGKLLTHRRYLESGLFQETYGRESFRTLVFTTGERRAGHLRALAEEHGASLFRFTTFGRSAACGVFGGIWSSPGARGESALLDD